MKLTCLTYVCWALLCPVITSAQRPLTIGDTLPDIVIPRIINHSSSSFRLADYSDKLLFLDFWATHCGACITSYRKLDSLQQVFGSKMKVLLVNSSYHDDEKRIRSFITWREVKEGKPFPFPTTIKDSILKRLFPHSMIPHCVWVYKKKIIAITLGLDIDAKSIAAILKGKDIDLPVKKDQDKKRPLFVNEDLNLEQVSHYSLLLKGHHPGISGYRERRTAGRVHGRVYMNQNLQKIYFDISRALLGGFNKKRILIDSNAIEALLDIYSYEFTLPVALADSLYPLLLQHLNILTGISGRVEPRKVMTWSLETTGTKLIPPSRHERMIKKSIDSFYLRNGPSKYVAEFVGYYPFLDDLVLDQTGINYKIDFEIPPGINNIDALQRALKRGGLKLVSRECVLDMFVISKDPLKPKDPTGENAKLFHP